MTSYRFCRSDDVPLLVQAHNACYLPHVPDAEPLDRESFKALIPQIDLWTSSCMVALDGEDPVAVLLAGKRETENLIYRVGVARGHQRRGHGRHLLTSLSQKMAILGPPRLIAEVAEDAAEQRSFVEACGYRAEATLVDWQLHPDASPTAEQHPLVTSICFEDVEQQGLLTQERGPLCWSRTERSLRSRADSIQGLALATDVVEAYLLWSDSEDSIEIETFDSRDPDRGPALLPHLFAGAIARAEGRVIRLRRASERESAMVDLGRLGFLQVRRTVLYAAQAVPL